MVRTRVGTVRVAELGAGARIAQCRVCISRTFRIAFADTTLFDRFWFTCRIIGDVAVCTSHTRRTRTIVGRGGTASSITYM